MLKNPMVNNFGVNKFEKMNYIYSLSETPT